MKTQSYLPLSGSSHTLCHGATILIRADHSRVTRCPRFQCRREVRTTINYRVDVVRHFFFNFVTLVQYYDVQYSTPLSGRWVLLLFATNRGSSKIMMTSSPQCIGCFHLFKTPVQLSKTPSYFLIPTNTNYRNRTPTNVV